MRKDVLIDVYHNMKCLQEYINVCEKRVAWKFKRRSERAYVRPVGLEESVFDRIEEDRTTSIRQKSTGFSRGRRWRKRNVLSLSAPPRSRNIATFTRNGIFNFHNAHTGSDENPRAAVEMSHQRRFSIKVWAEIVLDQLVGPYFLPNRERILQFLTKRGGRSIWRYATVAEAKCLFQARRSV